MSDNLPAVRQPAEILTADTDSWISVVGNVAALAEKIAGTEFVPRNLRNSVPAVAAAILYGREVGLPPMTALTQTHVIEGRPSMSAEAMRALIIAGGHELAFEESTGAVCRMRARRRDSEHWTTLAWSLDMARAAGLLGKDNWKHYPRAMLVARCTADLARMVFPDVIHGFRALEETEDMASGDGPAVALTGPKMTVKRSPRRAAAALPGVPEAPAAAAAPRPATVQGPPLPGEDGYDNLGQVDSPPDEPVAEPVAEGVADSEGVVEGATDDGPPQPAGEAGHEPEETPSTTPDDDPAPPAPARAASRTQHRLIFGLLGEMGIDTKDDEERLLITSKLASRAIGSFNDLSTAEASHIIDTLGRVPDRAALNELLDAIDEAES